MDYCIRAGVKTIICFGIGLTLREGNREYFYAALDKAAARDKRFLGLKDRYIRTYGNSYIVSSPDERALMSRLDRACRENGIMLGTDTVFKWMEEFPEDPLQAQLF